MQVRLLPGTPFSRLVPAFPVRYFCGMNTPRAWRARKHGWIVKSVLLPALAFNLIAASAQPPGEGGRKLRRFHELLDQAKARGQDTAEAERLDRLSRSAAQGGDRAEAERLLEEAMAILEMSSPEAAGTRPEYRPGPPRDRGRPDRPGANPSFFDGPNKPVFVLAFTHHYEGPGGYYPTAAEVRRMGRFFVDNGIPGTLFFDGILIERLQREDPTILPQVREWGLPLGYHGEETHGPYPVASELLGEVYTLHEAQGYRGPWSLTTGKDWNTAVALVEERYSHARPYRLDESARMLDRRQPSETDRSRVGGLKLVQQAFGKDVSMLTSHGLESAPEGYAFRRMSRFGLDQPAVPIALHALRIFRIGETADGIMRIAGEDESLFWYMGRLTCKGDEAGEAGYRFGPLRHTLETLDRRRPRLLLMGFSKVEEQEGARTARYLEEEFFPANPGSGWVTGDTLADRFEPEKGFAPSTQDVEVLARALTQSWKDRPPDLVAVGGRVYSLCDAFEALARNLANRPAGSDLRTLYGPVLEDDKPLLARETAFTVEAIRAAASSVVRALDGVAGDRFVPATVSVGGAKLNSAEFLQAMAGAVLAAGPAESVTAPPSRVFPPYADLLQEVFKPRAAQPLCYTKGQLWTVKPARLRAESSAPTASAPAAALSGQLKLVFAANLDSDQSCTRDAHGGADLYGVDYDLATGEASNLRRLTDRTGLAEWFPALSPDGRWAVYDREERPAPGRSRPSLHVLDLETGGDSLLAADARFAAFSADGRTLFYSRQERGEHSLWKAEVQAADSTFRLGPARPIADSRTGGGILVEDPSPFPDGTTLAYHRKVDDASGAQAAVIGAEGSSPRALTPADGCGHVAVSPDGQAVACTRSRDGRLVIIRKAGDPWKAPEDVALSDRPADYAGFDPRFGRVREVRHSYVEWLAPDLLLLTTHGADGARDFNIARLFLVQLGAEGQRPQLVDLSTPIEKLAGRSGRDFCSAAGRLTQTD